MGASPVGEKLGLSCSGVATALTGSTWATSIEDVMYDVEFTGELTPSGKLEVIVKKKSEKHFKKR